MCDRVTSFYSQLTAVEKEKLCTYLRRRFDHQRASNRIGVVFDVLHNCILRCVGCGTNASYQATESAVSCAPSLKEIEAVFHKIDTYASETGKRVFINIGGGEPFLRADILEILEMAASFFGKENVGVDTNAVLSNAYDLLLKAMPYLSYVGVSINGLRDYHNWWANCGDYDAFSRSLHSVSELCKIDEFQRKIEVTSVATKRNLHELPQLIELLASYDVRNYSIHRAIPVGRMARHLDLLPNASDYLRLFVDSLVVSEKTGVNFHIHHSIEAIHAALLLGIDTYLYDHIGNPDALSSIGIDPECSIVFDPWCTTGRWKTLSAGNLLRNPKSLNEMISAPESVFQKTATATSFENKCNGCAEHCSGGSRIVAATSSLSRSACVEFTDLDLYTAMKAIDPACPLYCEKVEK